MGLMVALISLSVAAFGLVRWLRSDVATWYEGKELGLGVGVIVVLTISFIVAQTLARPPVVANTAN